jgi:uncharacterized protein (DUF2236 family)
MPSPEEFAELTPTPGSPVWRAASDVRLFAASGYATLLQVAHPTVGAGVHDYSSFLRDPWGRLLRTLDYVNGTIYSGPEVAGEIGARVRAIHKTIKGTKPDGSRYHAMEPDAFAWVHATLAEATTAGHREFIRPMTRVQKQAYWDEWRGVGRLVGVRERDLPEDWGDFETYVDQVIDERLVHNPAVDEVLMALSSPTPPKLPGVNPRVWAVINKPAGWQLRVATVGLMPARLRARLGLPWTSADELAFKAIGAASRASGPVLPARARNFGPTYAQWRRRQIARGDVASGTPEKRAPKELAPA